MTKEDIIRMTHESGLCDANGEDDDSIYIAAQIEHFAKLVAEAEREECARVCLETEPFYGQMFADAIRARGQQADPVPPWYRQFCNCPKCSEAPKQAEPVQAEPVARVLQTVGQYHTGRFVAEVETIRKLRDGEPLYTHPQQQAEPVVVQAKPVVWDPQCPLCGVGDGGKAMGYVCPRGDCPTKVTCGGAV